jgi:CARDB
MPRSAPLLTVALVAALALPPPASLAQQRGRQQIPPGGPVVSSGRVLDQPFPDLRFTAFSAGDVKCIRPFTGQVTITVEIKNDGTVAAVMPPTLPVLGRYWVGVWDLSTHPGVMFIAAGPSQLPPGQFKKFLVDVIVKQGANASGVAFGVGAKIDPQNFIFESNENNNEQAKIFISKSLCK